MEEQNRSGAEDMHVGVPIVIYRVIVLDAHVFACGQLNSQCI